MGVFGISDPTGGLLSNTSLVGNMLFDSPSDEAAEDLSKQQRQNAQRYREYRPDAMGLRRESLQAALQMFGPLGQYVQQQTGMAPPDINAMFAPAQRYEEGLRTELNPSPRQAPPPGNGPVQYTGAPPGAFAPPAPSNRPPVGTRTRG